MDLTRTPAEVYATDLNVEKADVITLENEIIAAIDVNAANIAGLTTGSTAAQVRYATKAAMDADHTQANNTLGYVYADGANNGLYYYTTAGTTWHPSPDAATTAIAAETARAEAEELALKGETITQGLSPVAGAGPAAATWTWFMGDAFAHDGVVSGIRFQSRNAGIATLVVADLSGGNFIVKATKDIVVTVGLNTPDWTPFVQAGWWGGIYSALTAVVDYASSAKSLPRCSGLVGSSSASSTVANLELEMEWTIETGLSGERLRALAKGDGGFGLLDAADPTGVVDATAEFAKAIAKHPNPYVPPGTYAVTTIPNSGYGFWGPGTVLVDGVRLSLPMRPERFSRWHMMRGRLVSQIQSGSPVMFNGDSITNGLSASAVGKSFVSLFTRYANLGIAKDEAVFVNWDPNDSSGGPSFHGITINGSVINGMAGPVSTSLLLQAGQYFELTGAYSQIDVTYQQASGAGTLQFKYNGSAYKTVVCTGATTSDVFTGPSATGQTASGTYRITNTGASAVEITSLVRLGVLAAGTPPPRLHVCRFAHGGCQFDNYGSGQIASMIRIATALAGGTRPLLMPALGTNDEAGSGKSYATLLADVTAYVNLWVAAGVPVRNIIPIMPWRWSIYPVGGSSFEQGNAAIRDAFAAAGVTQFVATDGVDIVALGLVGSGAHPNDAGFALEFNLVVDALSGV